MKIKVSMLSTIDNPFDPFLDFENWLNFDTTNKYNCCEYLARIAKTSENLTLYDENQAIDEAIDEIVKSNPLKIYKKVSKELEIENYVI